jgi:hypothetical protein
MVMGMEVMLQEFLAFQLHPSRRILIPHAFICRKSPCYPWQRFGRPQCHSGQQLKENILILQKLIIL